jgi:hypothetical protein
MKMPVVTRISVESKATIRMTASAFYRFIPLSEYGGYTHTASPLTMCLL